MSKGVMYIAVTVVALGALALVAGPASVAVAEDDGGCCTELVEALDNMCSELTQMNETLAGEETKKPKIEWEGIAGPPGSVVDAGTYAEAIAAEVAAATGDRFAIEFNPSTGTPTQDFDAIDTREKDITITLGQPVDQFGPAQSLFSGPEALLSAAELPLWYLAEGQDLLQQMLSGTNVRGVDGGRLVGPTQVFLHSAVAIDTISDFAGLKIRVWGPVGEVFEAWEAYRVSMPGREIYEAMENGWIHAFEFGTLSTNWSMAFAEVSDYVYLSECRAPSTSPLLVNQESWSELPDEFKVIFEAVAADQAMELYERWCEDDLLAYEQFQNAGCTVERLDPEIESAFVTKMNEVYDDLAAEDAFLTEVLASQREFLQDFRTVWPGP